MDIVLYALTVLLYGGLCAADWRALRRAGTAPLLGSVPPVPVTLGAGGDALRARTFGPLSR
ncbi:inner membrane protein YpjD, partial [Paraburkholderia sp. BR14262]